MIQPDHTNGIGVPRACKPVLLSLLILVSGILIGSGVTFIVMQKNLPKNPEPGWEYFSERMMRHLENELQLTPKQRETMEPIIKKHFDAMDQIRLEARPKISDEIKQMNDSLLAMLSEPQKQIWEDRVQRMRDVFPREGFGQGRGGPGGGPGGGLGGGPGGGRRGGDDDRRGGDADREGRRLPWRGEDPNRSPREDGQWRGPMGPGYMGPGYMGPGQMGPGYMGPGYMGPGQTGPGSMEAPPAWTRPVEPNMPALNEV